jgi:hypothetical protein
LQLRARVAALVALLFVLPAATCDADDLTPLELAQAAPGDYVFAGSAVMSAINEGAIANIAFV